MNQAAVGSNFEIGQSLISNSKFQDLKLDHQVRGPIRNFEISGLRLGFVQFQNLPVAFGLLKYIDANVPAELTHPGHPMMPAPLL